LKEKIKQTSIRLFVEKGFMETSIQDIVDELQVTKGTFYYYYTSKEELLTDIHQEYIDAILAKQEEVLSHEEWNWQRKLYEIVYFLISDIENQGPSARIFHRELRNLSGERQQDIIAKRDQFRRNIEHVLKMGAESGEFRRDLQAGIISLAVLGITNWSYEWFNPKGRLSAREVADLFMDMIMNGIRNEDGGSAGRSDGNGESRGSANRKRGAGT
jgi:AcrR family transcriptional regulator